MFKQLTRRFMNLRLGSKLLIGFGIMVVISIVIGAAALITTTLITNRTVDVRTNAKQSALAENIRADMEVARDNEAGYFLNYKTLGLDAANTRYAAANQAEISQVVEHLVALRQEENPNLAGDRPVIRLLVVAEDQMKAYQDAFNSAVKATQERGVLDTGAMGAVRSSGNALETEPLLADPTVQLTVVQMRNLGKDYLLYGTQDSITQVQDVNAKLQNQIRALNISDDQKNTLLALADTYLTNFNAVVAKDREVTIDLNNLGLISTNINQLLTEVSNQKQANTDNAMASLQSVANLARAVNIVALALAVLFGLGLALVLRQLLTRQVKEIDRVFSDVRVGDFATRARIFAKDELGQMADGLNGLLEQLTDLLGEARQHLNERIRELTALHETSRLLQDESQADLLQQVTNLLPPAYQYPEIAAARLVYGSQQVSTPDFAETPWTQSAEFTTSDGTTGQIDVVYLQERPEAVEGVFLAEERSLLDSVADLLRTYFDHHLAEAEARRQLSLIASTSELVGLADMQGNIVYFNPAGATMAGYNSPSEMIGKTFADLHLPEDTKRVLEIGVPEALEHGNWHTENRLLRTDGTLITVEETLTTIRDANGQPQNIATIMTDITERKQSEVAREQMIDEMARQKAILDNINDFAAIADLQGHILYVNTAGLDMVGLAHEDFARLTIPDFYPPEESEKIMRDYLPLVQEKGIWSGETVFLHEDGTRIPVQEVIVLIWNKVGEPQAFGTICRDLREQKRIVMDVEKATAQVTNASLTMNDVIQSMITQAVSSSQVAEQAAVRAQEGDRMVNETVAAMGRIRDNTQETAQRIKRLGEVSQEIGEAVRLIEELADRTTVLALNASIQAAVAGEAGRGFAVVAEEVQRLAERATGATRKIESLIKNIQAETNQVVVGVEEATREVVGGSRLAQQAGESMSELNKLVAQLAALIQQVAETTATQTNTSMASLTQLSKGLQESVAAFGMVEPVSGDGQSPRPISSKN